MPVLEVRDLHKHYGDHHALDGPGLAVEPGEVYGLLGPNGAGKTTLMKAVLGLQRSTSGEIRLFGEPFCRERLAQVGALIESPGLWSALNADEHLEIHARLRNVPDAWRDEVLSIVALDGPRDRKVAKYSLGMRWRLGIAIAMLARPRLLLLDEPTNGLDPVGIRDMRRVIRALADGGTSVLVSSHDLTEITHVCDRVAVLVAGRTRYEGPIDELAVGGDLEAAGLRPKSVA
jgi:ABC-2 type transport system ATP-binding protein